MTQVAAPESSPAPSVAQPTTPETVVTQPDPQPKPPTLPSNPIRKALAVREQAIKAREAELKLKETQLQQQLVALQPPKPVALKDRLLQDPAGTLQQEGLTYEQLTQLMVNAPSPEVQRMSQLERDLTERLARMEGQLKANEEGQLAATMRQISQDVSGLIKRSEDYPFIQQTGSEEDVAEYIRAEYEKSGTLLSTEDACKAFEEDLMAQYRKVFESDKVKARLAPKADDPAAPQPGHPASPAPKAMPDFRPKSSFTLRPVGQPSPTLTNAHTVSVPKGDTKEEWLQRAILKAQGKL
jgi:hypothetical protein